MTVSKGKDGIPGWDGNPSTWSEYKSAAFLYEDTVKWENRYLCGPRLAAELSGAAKAAIGNKKRGWLSRSDGVEKLIHCLRDAMAEPALPEIANQLKVYFKLLRRRKGETMSAFCVRHREEYARTCKAMTRVMREQNQLELHPKHAWHSGRRSSQSTLEPNTIRPEARSTQTGGSSERASETPSHVGEQPTGGDEETHTAEETEWPDYTDAWWWWYQPYMGWDWSGEDLWHEQPSAQSEPAGKQDSDDEEDFIEILPDVIKGWLLLEKANIDHMERSLIQSEVRNRFSLQSVENALRSHFTDDAIKKKDGEPPHAMFENEEDFDETGGQPEDESFFEDLSEEAMVFYQQAKEEEEAAWLQIQQGRQTLKEARAKQHEVRMGRKFFDVKRKPFGGRMGERQAFGKGQGKKSYGPCARCGKGHDTKFCPQKSEASGSDVTSFEAEEHSEFIYGQLWCGNVGQCPGSEY